MSAESARFAAPALHEARTRCSEHRDVERLYGARARQRMNVPVSALAWAALTETLWKKDPAPSGVGWTGPSLRPRGRRFQEVDAAAHQPRAAVPAGRMVVGRPRLSAHPRKGEWAPKVARRTARTATRSSLDIGMLFESSRVQSANASGRASSRLGRAIGDAAAGHARRRNEAPGAAARRGLRCVDAPPTRRRTSVHSSREALSSQGERRTRPSRSD